MARLVFLEVSLTETAQYRRLVDFFTTVVELAQERDDDELLGLARDCSDDLLAMAEEL